ncbi:MAG: thiosulfate oxidation carrier protein SoxY [Candidatus Velthaea sp.]
MTTSPQTRRTMLALAGRSAAVAIAACVFPSRAWATPAEAKTALATLGPGTPQVGKITLGAPEIAENGNTVPIVLDVDSPMTDQSYVKSIMVVADGNPLPGVARFDLTPANGKAHVEFRMRLAQTQNVTAVALMSDGSMWSATKNVKVTIGGCGG